MIYDISNYYDIYDGKSVLENPELYLRKARGEEPEHFLDRAKWVSFTNWCKKAHTIYMGYLFSGKPKIKHHAEFDIRLLAYDIAHHALIGGYCWILVLPKTGPSVYRGDRITKTDKDNKIFSVTGKYKTYTIDLNQEIIIDNESGESETFKEDQLIFVKWNSEKASLFIDAAPMNIEIFNLESAQSFHIQKSLLWFIETSLNKMPIPYRFIQRSKDDPETKFVQPESSAIIKTIEERITFLILNIGAVLGISSEFSREIIFQAGISKMIDLIDTNSIIKQISYSIVSAANKAALAYYRMKGGEIASISLDPVLRPQDSSERREELKDAIEVLNSEVATKAFQKLYLSLFQSDFMPDEYDMIMNDIEKNGGKMKRDILMEGISI